MQYRTKYETSWVDGNEDIWIIATNKWRYQKPVMRLEECHQCGWCYLYCPTACIMVKENGYFEINLEYCKGCGICAHECPAGCISMEREEIS